MKQPRTAHASEKSSLGAARRDTGDVEDEGGLVHAERARLVQERQTQLEGVVDHHDSLLREAFHLEKFVTLLAYDPKAAKEDKSAVFETWKAKYDLLQSVSVDAGPSRKTRRGHNARLESLKGAANQISISASTVSSSARQGAKPARPAEKPTEIWDTLSVNRTKGKQKATLAPVASDSVSEAEESASTARLGRPAGRSSAKTSVVVVKTRPKPSHPTSLSTGAGRRGHRSVATDVPVADSPHPRKRRKTDLIQVNSREEPLQRDHPPDETSFSAVKRVTLIVRRPPRPISHPDQRPPRRPHDGDLSRFLSSYTMVSDEDADPDGLQAEADSEAKLRERIFTLRRQGGLVRPPNDWSPEDFNQKDYYQGNDLWSEIVESAVAAAQARSDAASAQEHASRVAAKIRAHWEGIALKEDKARAAEERRLRQMAKFTIKMVVGEWKKAVFHIREQDRLRVEEEERRRGREHLDAILSQSGQILEAQHKDLSKLSTQRLRSRSSSMLSDTLRNWGEESASDDEQDSDDETEHNDTEQDEMEEQRATFPIAMDEQSHSHSMTERQSGSMGPQEFLPDARVWASPFASTTPVETNIRLSAPPELHDAPPALSSSSSTASHLSPSNVHEGTPASPRSLSDSIVDSTDPRVRSASEVLDDGHSTMSSLLVNMEAKSDQSVFLEGDPDATAVPEDALPFASTSADDQDVCEGAGLHVADGEGEGAVETHLRPYAVAPVAWDPEAPVTKPILLRGVLRPYQQEGLEWLASLHTRNQNGILADEMGLGKTIQTISLLAHLACDRGIWGPHLIIVPTSVLLNWSMEFKKFLPGFKVLSYHGTAPQRKELRQGWNDKYSFNVCVTSYTLASKDAHIFKRKPWYYMILDEAHMIKNFKSQRWNTLLMFRSFRRLLLTGTPVQNNLTELWALLQFLLSGTNFANREEFADWFSDPLEKAVELGGTLSAEIQKRATKLHDILKPHLLRREKSKVEKQLPSKYEHLVLCPLSKRQRFLYDEFMMRRQTSDDLGSGMYYKIANILMQLRKVCNHPDLFEVRSIVTSFAMARSVVADFEIKDLLVRRRLLRVEDDAERVNLDVLGLRFIDDVNTSKIRAVETRRLDATSRLPGVGEQLEPAPLKDLRTIAGYKRWHTYQERAAGLARWTHIGYLNALRCAHTPIYSAEAIVAMRRLAPSPLLPLSVVDTRFTGLDLCTRVHAAVLSLPERASQMADVLDRFAFATPAAVARDLPQLALLGSEDALAAVVHSQPALGSELHRVGTRLTIAFPDPSLLQYDCGKLQALYELLRERQAGGHRALIFTQMTRVLDILEQFLSMHGWLYLRLDGATKIEDRQYITERFNADARIFCFISSSRSGGVGINLTGADTVVFYDSDFNPQMDRQCEDRAHRIGQARDVHIYRFAARHTVEEALLAKAGQKRALDELVIQRGAFDWRTLFGTPGAAVDSGVAGVAGGALLRAMAEVEDGEDRLAASLAEREVAEAAGAERDEFGAGAEGLGSTVPANVDAPVVGDITVDVGDAMKIAQEEEEEEEEGGTVVEYMVGFVHADMAFFDEWRV